MVRVDKHACSSCPYKRATPSGVWHEQEYAKLEAYDAETFAQPTALFMCHKGATADTLCRGWVRVHGHELLALRLAGAQGDLDDSVYDALDADDADEFFTSGAEAAEHGRREIAHPSAEAQRLMGQIAAVRARQGRPVIAARDTDS